MPREQTLDASLIAEIASGFTTTETRDGNDGIVASALMSAVVLFA